MVDRTRSTETRSVTVLSKRRLTETLASALVVESGSNKKYSIKFQSRADVDCLMNDVEAGTMVIIRGFMSEYKGRPEFTVYSFEVNSRARKTFYPSEEIEYVIAKPKNKAIN